MVVQRENDNCLTTKPKDTGYGNLKENLKIAVMKKLI